VDPDAIFKIFDKALKDRTTYDYQQI
jgi:CRP-like cAMP-binding protein